jgi:hypothetical protein
MEGMKMETDNITKAIKIRRTSIARLQGEIDTLEHARSLLAGESVAPVLPPEPAPRSTPARSPKRGGRRRRAALNPESAPGHAAAVLRENGTELHVYEIHTRIKKRGKGVEKSSVWSTLAKMAKRGEVFYKGARAGYFGLLEWKAAKMTNKEEGTATAH